MPSDSLRGPPAGKRAARRDAARDDAFEREPRLRSIARSRTRGPAQRCRRPPERDARGDRRAVGAVARRSAPSRAHARAPGLRAGGGPRVPADATRPRAWIRFSRGARPDRPRATVDGTACAPGERELLDGRARRPGHRLCRTRVGAQGDDRVTRSRGAATRLLHLDGPRAARGSAPAARLEEWLEGLDAQRYTSRTVVDPSRLRRIVENVRRDGYVWVEQELEAGLCSLAVPLRDRAGRWSPRSISACRFTPTRAAVRRRSCCRRSSRRRMRSSARMPANWLAPVGG